MLDEFHSRKLRPEEPLSLFVHELKQLLEQAMPGIDPATSKQLLLHQFIAGLPTEVRRTRFSCGPCTLTNGHGLAGAYPAARRAPRTSRSRNASTSRADCFTVRASGQGRIQDFERGVSQKPHSHSVPCAMHTHTQIMHTHTNNTHTHTHTHTHKQYTHTQTHTHNYVSE